MAPILAGGAQYKRLPTWYRILFYFFVATIGFEVQASVLGYLYGNNMPGLHFFTAVEFLVFTGMYWSYFQQPFLKWLIVANAVGFAIAVAIEVFVLHRLWAPNSIARSYASISLVGYALLYLYFMFRGDELAAGSRQPMFWINTGVLIYFGSNTIYFLLSKQLIPSGLPAAEVSLYVHGTLNLIANVLYAQAFRCFKSANA